MNWHRKGKHRAGPGSGRLRRELKLADWYRGRLHVVNEQNRALKARAEIAEGIAEQRLLAVQQRDTRIADLERLIAASSEDTVQTPIPQQAEPELAGVAS